MAGSAFAILAAQPAQAAATLIEEVKLSPTEEGLSLALNTSAGESPQVFAASKGNSLQADIVNARLAQGKSFVQKNPTPGIASIQLEAIDADSVRLTIDGEQTVPVSQIQKLDGQVLISLDTRPNAAELQAPSVIPETIETVPGEAVQLAQAEEEAPDEDVIIEDETEEPVPDVLVPDPEIIIDGNPVAAPTFNGAPPFLPRAVAPPVGDMSVSDVDAGLDVIDLGTAERVPRLVLRDAPAREVLALLARAAGLNLAFTDANAEEASEEVRVTLDIENEPVQNVFNYVLQIADLEANRVGRTIFVGSQLPTGARNVIVRSIRLNQVDVSTAVNFLVAMGAESAVSRERLVTSVNAVEVGEGADITESQTTTEARIENQRVDYVDTSPLLRGLQAIGEERTNSITLIGTPRQIQIATAQLTQIDLRRRQVAVNVRVIDVDLNALDRFGTSFSFGVGDIGFLGTAGSGVINFGDDTPASGTLSPTGPLGTPILPNAPGAFQFASQFLLQLQAVVTNGQAKILTDPTLVVQEGQTAAVQLTEEVITNIEIEREGIGDELVSTVTFEKEDAGLNLQVQIERIDDNGFVTMSVAPSISAPVGTFDIDVFGGQAVLLSDRQLSSGQIRVRDGQTLILSGIIRENDRVDVSKVPILGDLPLIGALFRSTSRQNQRQEVIVLLTPQILDDSDESVYGYSYTPGEDVQELLEDRATP
ncbi:MAG: AMIN domain-containing protein [Leptolyngbya sp. SIO4C1]|nr:AMIN domain-containing protein [Leptolyngbya sp. SIO4C1]